MKKKVTEKEEPRFKTHPNIDPEDGEQDQTHPSYGTVGFSRVQGGHTKLFGSPIKTHHNTVYLRIGRATMRHHLGKDWIHGGIRSLIEVQLSEVQFASLLTTMNVGTGVPCTIRSLQGERVENPPDNDTETERVKSGFANKMKKLGNDLETAKPELSALLEKPTLTKADRAAIQNLFDMFLQQINSNIPFAMDSFVTATDKVISAAKAEVDAFMTNAVTQAGLHALRSTPLEEVLKQLPKPEIPEVKFTAAHLQELSNEDEEA